VIYIFCFDPLFLELYKHTISKLSSKSKVILAKTLEKALNLLQSNPSPHGIFVADASIIEEEEFHPLSRFITKYCKKGGRVILGAFFSASVSPPNLKKYFATEWGLPWEMGSYHRTDVHLNASARGITQGLKLCYSQKAAFLENVRRENSWYLPNKDSVVQSLVFAPTPVPTNETPVAFIKMGSGWLGYAGDVNGEEGTDYVYLGMLGLDYKKGDDYLNTRLKVSL